MKVDLLVEVTVPARTASKKVVEVVRMMLEIGKHDAERTLEDDEFATPEAALAAALELEGVKVFKPHQQGLFNA